MVAISYIVSRGWVQAGVPPTVPVLRINLEQVKSVGGELLSNVGDDSVHSCFNENLIGHKDNQKQTT